MKTLDDRDDHAQRVCVCGEGGGGGGGGGVGCLKVEFSNKYYK